MAWPINVDASLRHFDCLRQAASQLVSAEKKYGLRKSLATYEQRSAVSDIDEGLYILSVFINAFQDIPVDMQEELFRDYLKEIKFVLDNWLLHFNRYDLEGWKRTKNL